MEENTTIFNYIYLDGNNLDLVSKNKNSLLKEMFKGMSNHPNIIDKEKLFEDLMKREEFGSTGIGKGVAIPHAKSSFVKDIIISIGIVKEGIEYQSIDGEKVNLIFMFFAPLDWNYKYLKTLAKIARFIKEEEFREKLINAVSSKEIVEIIESFENR